jgi:putative tricarboxylic transport membrane protein
MKLIVILLVMSIAGIYEGLRLSQSTLLFADPVGPGRYLFAISCLLFASAVALLVKYFTADRATRHELGISAYTGPAGQCLLLLFLYGFAIDLFGYLVASVPFFILIQRLSGERSWIRCTVIGVVLTGSFYYTFSYLAGMPLP